MHELIWLFISSIVKTFKAHFDRSRVNFVNILWAAFPPVVLFGTYWRTEHSYHKFGITTGLSFDQRWLVKQKLSAGEFAHSQAACKHVDEINPQYIITLMGFCEAISSFRLLNRTNKEPQIFDSIKKECRLMCNLCNIGLLNMT